MTTLLTFLEKKEHPFSMYRCACGTVKKINQYDVKKLKSKSCGCYNRQSARNRKLTHGLSGTKIHRVWAAMLKRCRNPKDLGYKNYGGRGIKVCDRWIDSFEYFYKDMGPRPNRYTIERRDNNGDYCPENCSWQPYSVQGRNTRKNKWITVNGEKDTISGWAARTGIKIPTLVVRLRSMPPEEALNPERVRKFKRTPYLLKDLLEKRKGLLSINRKEYFRISSLIQCLRKEVVFTEPFKSDMGKTATRPVEETAKEILSKVL